MPIIAKRYIQNKGLDYTPRLGLVDYWLGHVLLIATVEEIRTSKAGIPELCLKKIKTISGLFDFPKTISIINILYWNLPYERPKPIISQLPIAHGDYLLVIIPKAQRGPIIVTRLDNLDNNPLVKTLDGIAKIFHDQSNANLLEGAFCADNEVAGFSLQLLQNNENVFLDVDCIDRLIVQANDPTRNTDVRLQSYGLAAKLQKGIDKIAFEHAWLKETVKTHKAPDWRQIRPYVTRMAELSKLRKDSVSFLCGLALDESANLAIRIAIYSVFQDRRLFNYTNPDEVSEKIFSTSIEMLAALFPKFEAGQGQFCVVSPWGSSNLSANRFLNRALQAMQLSLACETVPATKAHLSVYINYLLRKSGYTSMNK